MSEVKIADWIQQITGDKAPLNDLREWEHRSVAAWSELLDGYKADIPAILNDIAHVRKHPGLVLEQGINFTSVCYHHFLPFFHVAALLTELGAGLSLLLGYKARLGALILFLFLIPVTLTFHNFWTYTDPKEHTVHMIMFMHNLALMGGLLLVGSGSK